VDPDEFLVIFLATPYAICQPVLFYWCFGF
jgi:hypothetical protein